LQSWPENTCKERRYPPQSTVYMAERPMNNYDSPYEWNNHNSTRKQRRMIKYLESKAV
jgi:hypothetical protein